jgi:hypothetical protein
MKLHRQQNAARPASSQGAMDPRDRLRRFGPIRPMPVAPSLIERILFF